MNSDAAAKAAAHAEDVAWFHAQLGRRYEKLAEAFARRMDRLAPHGERADKPETLAALRKRAFGEVMIGED